MSKAKSYRRDRQRRAEVIADHTQLPSIVDASELFFAWWPSSSFPMPWWPELYESYAELFQRAHRSLTTTGFLVIDDPYNETGEGRIWRLVCKPTRQLKQGVEPADLARGCLESRDVKVEAVEPRDGVFYVYLSPPATMEDRLRDAWTMAKESVATVEISSSTTNGVILGDSKWRPPNRGERRLTFVEPILEEKGWSRRDWAVNSGLDWHTIDNFLEGKNRPYASTRKKLADALGVRIADFPE